MADRIVAATLLVRDYDEAIEYFRRALGFRLLEDSALGGGKRFFQSSISSRLGPSGPTRA